MQLPVLVVKPDGSRQLFEIPEAFQCEREITVMRPRLQVVADEELVEDEETGDISIRKVLTTTEVMEEVLETDTIGHPAAAWGSYSESDFEAACPGWTFLPLHDPADFDRSKVRATRRPIADWLIHPDHAEVTYEVVDLPQAETRAAKIRAIDVERDRRLALGALYAGKRFSMSDTSRTDLSGMATTAGLVLSGALPVWPEAYAQGWIAIDNGRHPLPTPADGIALAATVALAYSATVQHARSLKDMALTADDPAEVDHLAGWPGGATTQDDDTAETLPTTEA
ncbi:hypothetical protein ABMY26_06445 (plasmid) [Azospirillum sp. HJ39]|uniref:DUF4376 domain-containing protein n=1 Tax=Azospirillum sp. HJ39 TaxID=3159496 RepID=UPI003555F223